MQLYTQIKKYLFLLACIFSVATAAHIVGLYIYEGAETVPEKGGTLTIGLIGAAPSLNPTQYHLDNGNDFALRFLYRGLIKYNLETGSMEGDLANCDLSKSYGEVRCFFKQGSVWSTGEKITDEDVLATYSLLAETDINKKLQSNLAKLAITREGDAIVFRSSTPSSELVHLLSTPIIKKSVTEKFRNGSIKPEDAVFSGPYSLEKRDADTVRQAERISLIRNSIAWNGAGYTKFVLRFYSTPDSLLAQTDSLNFIYPDRSLLESPSGRFAVAKFLTPDFIAAFANTERLSLGMRHLLLPIITRVQPDGNDPDNYAVKNPFFTSVSVVETGTGDIDKRLTGLGYYRKSALLEMEKSGVIAPATPPAAIPTPTVTPEKPTTPVTPAVKQVPKNTYFTSPSKDSIVVTEPRSEIVLSGTVPAGVDAVYIGSYRLKSFALGNTTFTYRARTDIGNLKEGVNTYALSFEKAGKKTGWETITIHVISDSKAREAKKNEIFWSPMITPPSPASTSTATGTVSSTATGSTSTGTTESTAPAASTGSTLPAEPVKPAEPAKSKFADLDEKYFYNKDAKRLTVTIRSLSLTPAVSDTTKRVTEALESAGIATKLEEIDNNPESISEAIKNGNKAYDILVTGVNLGFLGTYAFPYFHSGQSEAGYNFSKLRNPGLDILLEDLKSRDMPKEARERNQTRIIEFLRKEAVIAPISAEYTHYFLDKGIKDARPTTILPTATFLFDVLTPSYIKETHIIRIESKSVKGFFDWFMQHTQELFGIQSPWKTI